MHTILTMNTGTRVDKTLEGSSIVAGGGVNGDVESVKGNDVVHHARPILTAVPDESDEILSSPLRHHLVL